MLKQEMSIINEAEEKAVEIKKQADFKAREIVDASEKEAVDIISNAKLKSKKEFNKIVEAAIESCQTEIDTIKAQGHDEVIRIRKMSRDDMSSLIKNVVERIGK